MNEPQPLNPTSMPQVPLSRAPLARVIAQVRFPPILAIRNPDKVAVLQEALRETYPNLSREQVHSIDLTGGQTPNIHQDFVWRLADGQADGQKDTRWRVSLGVNFVALETSSYGSRNDFLDRLNTVVLAVEQVFKPASANRFGLRYIDRLIDNAVDNVGELVPPEVLGIIRASENPDSALGKSVIHLMTEAEFLAQNGTRVQGRWGQLPANATHDPNALEPVDKPSWILDLDMFTSDSQPFTGEGLLTTAKGFAQCLYWLFRQMVTDEFLKFYGRKP